MPPEIAGTTARAIPSAPGEIWRLEPDDDAGEGAACALGLVARRAVEAGGVVCSLALGEPMTVPSRWTIQVGPDLHAMPLTPAVRHIHHRCDPNVYFDVTTGLLRTTRDVRAGEELGAFYPATEWDMREPFDCGCGARECLGRIEGSRYLSSAVLARYHLAPHVHLLAGG